MNDASHVTFGRAEGAKKGDTVSSRKLISATRTTTTPKTHTLVDLRPS